MKKMLLSRKFVSDYVDIDVDTKTLAEDMTGIGNEYDSCGKLLPVSNLVIGKVVDCIAHPDSDHLHVCQVDIGQETLQIVCGAPNVRAGLKVIVALNGAVLPGGIIKKSIIRGQESNGMLCSMAELGLEHKFLTEKDVAGIQELPDDAPVGQDPIAYLQLDDEVIDFELTSNRGDLLSILGMAYEIGALYQKPVKEIDTTFAETKDDIKKSFTLDVQTDKCPLFLVKKVTNVTIKESPDFIKNRLIASGIRPINNVVDISNYVMLETGQPLHYYDADRLGDRLIVRMAADEEVLTTLDHQERSLTDQDIVIATLDGAVGLAGVMGGLTTEIEEDTKNIIIEAAIFDSTTIRKTSKKVLRSEASNRFEKGIDPKRTYLALLRSCYLLEKYADATIVGGMVEHKNMPIEDKVIPITVEKINQILGITLSKEEILTIFDRLAFTYKEQDNTLLVTVPTRRTDISIAEDLIEEVGRIYGIDKIVGKPMILPVKPGYVNKDKRYIRHKLADLGLNETLSYALISDKDVYQFTDQQFKPIKVLDPMSEERNTLRYSLLTSLLSIYRYNRARGQKDIRLFEIGKGFYALGDRYYEETKLSILMSGQYWTGLMSQKIDFYILKGILEELLDSLGFQQRYSFVAKAHPDLHPGQSASISINNQIIGFIGKIHPAVEKEDVYVAELSLDKLLAMRVKGMQYKEISKYPAISKDVAFVVDRSITSEMLEKTIKKAGGHLLTSIRLFDLYEGEHIAADKKSLAYSLTFQDMKRTLNEEEVMTIFDKIIHSVTTTYQADLRDK